MLVLERQLGETISIGGDITVTVIRIGKRAVKLGIQAPREVPIHRDDIRKTFKAQDDFKEAKP